MNEQKKKMIMTGVAAGLAVILAFASMWFTIIGPMLKERAEMAAGESTESTTDTTATDTSASAAGPSYYTPPGMPGMPGVPGTTGVGTTSTVGTGETTKSLPPAEKSRPDPFRPLVPPPPPPPDWQVLSASLPPITIARPGAKVARGEQTETAVPEVGTEVPRRVVGVVTGRRAYAILEQEGQTTVVRPGDVLPDLARVERIEPNRVLLRRNGRPIWVPLQASGEATAAAGTGVGAPGGYPYGAARPYPYGPGGPPAPGGYPMPGG